MDTPDSETGPLNLGNPVEFTIKDLALKVIELVGSKSKIEVRALPSDDPKQRQPDIGRATKALGWQPTVQLEEGLKRTISYFESLR
jgi:UDP-glucuronate decarboxylase